MKTNLTKREIKALLKCFMYLAIYFVALFFILNTSASSLIVVPFVILGALGVVKGIIYEADKLEI